MLLRRLAVFAGGWTLAAAESVCGEQVLGPLLGLIGESLVVAEEHSGEARYRLLEMIRQYGWERSTGADEFTKLRDRHRAWLQCLAEQADPLFRFDAQVIDWLDRLDLERDNVRAALVWSEGQPPFPASRAGLRLDRGAPGHTGGCAAISARGGAGLERMIARARSDPAQNRTPAFARALNGAAQLASYQGDLAFAVSSAEEVLSIWREVGDQRMIAWELSRVGLYRSRVAQPKSGLPQLEESVARCRELGDEPLLMGVLIPFGTLLWQLGEHQAAISAGEERAGPVPTARPQLVHPVYAQRHRQSGDRAR